MKKYLSFLLLLLILVSCKSIDTEDVNPLPFATSNILPAMEPKTELSNIKQAYNVTSSYQDERVGDTINIFDKEVREIISTPYGEKKGYIVLKLRNRKSDDPKIYKVVSAVTLRLINLLGFPTKKITESMEVEVLVENNKKEIVRRYVEIVESSECVALYYGYKNKEVNRKIAADNMQKAMNNIAVKIASEATEIIKELN